MLTEGNKNGTKKLKPEDIGNLRKTLTVSQIAKLKNVTVTPRTVYNAPEETD